MSGKGGVAEERDEFEEVKRFAKKETRRIRMWRIVVTFVLAVTALSVTLTTYRILQHEQFQNFKLGFDKFSRTVGDAAVQQQRTLRDSFRAVTDSITADALRTNAKWPFYSTPYYEVYAGKALRQSRAEIAAYFAVVEKDQRNEWIEYANANYEGWAKAGHITKYGNLDRLNEINYVPNMTKPSPDGFIPDDEWYEYWPMWLYSPPPAQYGAVNWNLITVPDYEAVVKAMKVLRGEAVITKVRRSVSTGTAFTEEEHDAMHSELKTGSSADHPHCFLWTPIYEEMDNPDSKFVAMVATGFAWDFSLRHLLPGNVAGMIAVIKNNCNQSYTYDITGKDAFFLGNGDLHESKYDEYEVVRELSLMTHPHAKETPGQCQYTMHIYPSTTFEKSYDSNSPEIFATVVAFTFGMVAVVFLVYDIFVEKRNQKIIENAARSNALVTSLFPGSLRERVLEEKRVSITKRRSGTKSAMKSLLAEGNQFDGYDDSSDMKPLADLFLDVTILFADIVGFTAWSSVREPFQVFTLLETVYSSFDDIAKNRRIFKVETVGDCYVAATGIPEPRRDHAIAMVRFASDCLAKMDVLVRQLEVELGPGTGELGLRIGIHSGPVTAGVLRGERARFQLFGDTVNTTARMESCGLRGRIHVSHETAEILMKSGKARWVRPRTDMIEAKGKGLMQTYWAVRKGDAAQDDAHSHSSTSEPISLDLQQFGDDGTIQKQQRLIEWNVFHLTRLLRQIVAHRSAKEKVHRFAKKDKSSPPRVDVSTLETSTCPLDEVKEIIMLPEFDTRGADQKGEGEVELDQLVLDQLRHFVMSIASVYHENPFHNFEHASHVCMSVIKLMSRIVAPDLFEDRTETDEVEQEMHDHTYGITSDPLTQFACALSALVHDMDHTGVPNQQLIKENSTLGTFYRNRSVAEQNSLDLAWEMLMQPSYERLRSHIYVNQEELKRFRELMVNSVMATDIADKELKALRNRRWDRAFSQPEDGERISTPREDINRKATIVIEHLIQASDVSHTMQHWHVYRKWNQSLFEEMYNAYRDGRADRDPAEFWYNGEIGFFDYYIIPLAKKLKDCGVFGISSDEYLNYAIANRREWEMRGQEVVAEMVQKLSDPCLEEGSARAN